MIKGKTDGFAKTFVKTLGCALSVVAAIVISRIASSLLYDLALKPGIIDSIEESLEKSVDTKGVVESLKDAIATLPAISKLIFDFSAVESSLGGAVDVSAAKIAAGVEESVICPVVKPLIEVLIFAIVLLILFAVVIALAKGSKEVNEVPVIGGVNAFFGGIFGAVGGIITLAVISAAIRFLLKAKGDFPWLSEAIISKTYIFKWIYFTVCGEGEFDLIARFLK